MIIYVYFDLKSSEIPMSALLTWMDKLNIYFESFFLLLSEFRSKLVFFTECFSAAQSWSSRVTTLRVLQVCPAKTPDFNEDD